MAGSLTVSANTNPAGSSNSMTLTLSGDLPDTRPDLTLIYARPNTGGITDGTNQLESATVTVVDGIAPTVTVAWTAVGNGPVSITLSEGVSEPVTSGTAGPGGFSLTTAWHPRRQSPPSLYQVQDGNIGTLIGHRYL